MTSATAKTKAKAQSLTADDLLRLHRVGIRGELIRGEGGEYCAGKRLRDWKLGAIAINPVGGCPGFYRSSFPLAIGYNCAATGR